MFCYNITENLWSFIEPKVSPPPTESFALVENNKNSCFYIFGGYNTKLGEFSNNLYFYDLKENFWKKIEYASQKNPGGRAGHSCVLYDEKIYLFGGEVFNQKYRDFWLFNLISLTWQEIKCEDTKILANVSLIS